MEIQGHIQNGVVVPDDAVALPDGAKVIIVLPAAEPAGSGAMASGDKSLYLDALARIDAIANENPGDAFSGADHDQALYGNRR